MTATTRPRRLILGALSLVAVSGCSTAKTGADACNIDGTYRSRREVLQGGCPTVALESTDTLIRNGDTVEVVSQGANASCPGNKILNDCSIVVACKLTLAGDETKEIGSFAGTLYPSGTGYAGQFSFGLTAAVPAIDGGTVGPCVQDYKLVMTRK
jgi:hypothetical protein